MHRYGKSVRFTAQTLKNAVVVGETSHKSFFDYKEHFTSYCRYTVKLPIILLPLYSLIRAFNNVTAFFTNWQRQDRQEPSKEGTNALVHHNKFLKEFHIIENPTQFEKMLILSTAIYVVSTMLEQSGARHLLNIPFPYDTVSNIV